MGSTCRTLLDSLPPSLVGEPTRPDEICPIGIAPESRAALFQPIVHRCGAAAFTMLHPQYLFDKAGYDERLGAIRLLGFPQAT